jgi:YhcH/YjgK/YiaL family protein
MIRDNIKNIDTYKDISPLFREATEIMKKIWAGDKAPCDTVVVQEGCLTYRILLNENRKNPVGARFEAHKKFIDVHFLLEGSEAAHISDPKDLTETVPYIEERDIAFYEGDKALTMTLVPGDFYVTFPWDAHAPDLDTGKDTYLKKAVIKILY